MRKNKAIVITILVCLTSFSCSNKPLLNAINDNPKMARCSQATKDLFSSINFDTIIENASNNWLFSPLSYVATDLASKAYAGDTTSLEDYKRLSLETNNTSGTSFNISSNTFVGANVFDRCDQQTLNDNYISTYQGTPNEIASYASKLLGKGNYDNQGLLIANVMEFCDSFVLPLKKSKRDIFKGATKETNKDFYTLTRRAIVASSDVYFLSSFRINSCEMTVFMPYETALSNYTPSIVISDFVGEEFPVEYELPEWKTEYSFSLVENDSSIHQSNEFSFTKEGIKGKSTTTKGPTSGRTPEMNVILDRPFYYAVTINDIPLMVGAIYDL